MDSQKITKEFRMAQWKQIIRERGESGESIKDFCNRVGVTKNSYMYWQRKIREAACRQLASITDSATAPAAFAEVVALPAQPPEAKGKGLGQVRLEAAGAVIVADGSYPSDKLASLLRELVGL